ncbi:MULTISPECIES: Mu transposase C-terminal domain-containing protein [Sphingomonadaceae]|uniref:Mu transposase C-terminal domain-containing protein n=1 Tax=Sphingomonadales TaxID=204457 RepID=UPI0011BFB06E|nr:MULTISPECIES: Mu transposase C-terminal domain-containing protein [Sphingomonadaceae]QSR20623.1 transposase [Novosphingobium sp. KA1]
MIERKPSPAPRRSLKSLEAGLALFPHFREHISQSGPVTSAQVAAISEATGLKERQIRTLAARYRDHPVAESLAPKPRGPVVGSHRIDPEVRGAIDALIDEIALKMVPPSRAEAARQIWGLLHADNGEHRFSADLIPSEKTIERLLAEIASSVWAKASMGSKTRSAQEAHPGEYHSDGFLDLVQMDHTRGDVILVDSLRREELGRLWITFLIEIWTRSILGYYVSFGDPSIFRCGRAVASALLPKQPVLAHLGVDVSYPMFGLFRRLHADQAKPHRSESFRRACVRNGIDPDVRKPGPAHLGGHIERLIGTMVGKLRLLPGATGSNVSARDGYDAEADAAMTLAEFERWLLCQIAVYHHAPHSALGGLCPVQVWEREAARHGPLLPVSCNTDELFRQFLPSKSLTVHSRGIQIKHRHYWHPALGQRIGQKIEVSWDERTIQHVYAELDGSFVQLAVIGQYPDVWEADWEAARARVRAMGRAYQADGGRTATARAIAAANQEIHQARLRTKEARRRAKRREGEGTTLADLRSPERPEKPPVQWRPVAELGEDSWLKVQS